MFGDRQFQRLLAAFAKDELLRISDGLGWRKGPGSEHLVPPLRVVKNFKAYD